MNFSAADIKKIARKLLRIVDSRAYALVNYVDSHYTMLAVVVIGTLGTAAIFLSGYFLRYGRYDWWRWKSRSAWRSIRLWIFLFAIKGGLQLLK